MEGDLITTSPEGSVSLRSFPVYCSAIIGETLALIALRTLSDVFGVIANGNSPSTKTHDYDRQNQEAESYVRLRQ